MPYEPTDEYIKSYPGTATYEEIKEWILKKYNTKVSSLYVAQVKAKHGLEMRDCYNKPRSENSRQPKVPPEKEKMIEEALTELQVIDFFDSNRQPHWLKEIMRSDWRAGAFLAELISKGTFFDAVGAKSKLLLLTEGDELISFCTYAEKDDIQPTNLTPWMGFVYTFPEHRGHHYVGKLFEEIECIAKEDGVPAVYISTNHVGLYEKYGCEFLAQMNDMDGTPSRVYIKKIG